MTEYPEYNPVDGMEDLPPLSELEQLQEDYIELRNKLKKAKEQLKYCIDIAETRHNTLLLKKLKEIIL